MRSLSRSCLISIGAVLSVASASEVRSAPELSQPLRAALEYSPMGPAPPDPTNPHMSSPDAQALGAKLFVDARLSGRSDMSCATCHRPDTGWTDGRAVARLRGGPGLRRTPSLLNVAYNRWYNWDGSADSLWSQVLGPIESEAELGGSPRRTAQLILSDPSYAAGVERVFGPGTLARCREGAGSEHAVAALDTCFSAVGKLLAAYISTIVSKPNRFDTFVAKIRAGLGVTDAGLNKQELEGLELFFGAARCATCHTGPTFSNGEFHNLALFPTVPDGWKDSGRLGGVRKLLASPRNALAQGLSPAETAALPTAYLRETPSQWGQFRTPSLRGAARQSHFMHHGQFTSLAQVIDFYSELKGMDFTDHHRELSISPLRLTSEQKTSLVKFLELIGE